jgi:tetratricopeptide (TPR) repeat protein
MNKLMRKLLFLVGVTAGLLLVAQSASYAGPVPEEARRYMARGQAAMEMAKSADEYDAAIKEFQKAIELAPDWPAPYCNLGLAQEKSNKLKEAVASYKKYLQLAPKASDSTKIQELIYKLEYRAEQVLTIPEIVDVLVSLSDQHTWQQSGEDCDWVKITGREGDDAVKVYVGERYYVKGYENGIYQTLRVTGPVLKYITTINVCDEDANRQEGGCDFVMEHSIEVVSKTLVKSTHKVLRQGSGMGRHTVGAITSCTFKKKDN